MSRVRVSSIIGIIFGLAFAAFGIFAVWYVLNTPAPTDGGEEPAVPDEPQSLSAKAFPDYTWDELAQIADLMEAAADEASARSIAREYGLVDAEGRLTEATHRLELDNGILCDVRLVGILHDTSADSGSKAALTFMASPIDVRRVNPTASSAGGWSGSELRAWLASDGVELLPDELAASIVSVRKLTNNTGKASTTDAVTATSDALWLFSCREVCGEISWLEDEFDYLSDGEDALLNAEGTQYEAFASAGVNQYSDSASYLIMFYQGKEVPWWYRTPYGFEYLATTDDTFYQVTSSGYASAVNLANDQAGIVVGFCL